MAVYTEVGDAELDAFLADYDIGEAEALQGHRRGRRELQLPADHDQGAVHPHALRKARRPEDLPFFLGLMDHLAARGINCPQADPRPRRQGAAHAGRQARRRSRPSCTACGRAASTVQPLRRRSARRWPACISPAATSRSSGPTRCRSRAGGRCSTAAAPMPTTWRRAWRASSAPSSTSSRPTGRTDLPARRDPCRLFPDNVFFLHDRLSGLIDFYFACNDALAYDVAICLNAWCFEPDQSFNATKARALLQGYDKVRPLERRRTRGPAAAGARRGAALPADPALRLGAHAGRCAGEAQGSARVSRQAALPSRRASRWRITACEDVS